jgi:predicted lipid-binding transport protein (Tim44 family)
MPTDIIIYAIIAAVMVFWLRNVIGTRHGEERERPNPFEQKPIQTDPIEETLQRKKIEKISSVKKAGLGKTDTTLDAGLVQIALADKSFDSHQFKSNATDAFTFIVTAFAEGDTETLKDLCTPDVYKSFEQAINDRIAKGETVSTEIHAVRKNDIIDAAVDKNKNAHITIRFTADETYVIRDSSSVILAGHPDRVTEMTDKWTFTRNLKSSDPRWLLSKTEDDVTDMDGKTPLPEAG